MLSAFKTLTMENRHKELGDRTNVTENEHLFVGTTLIKYGYFPRDGAPESSLKK